ncbi:MAG: dihydrolipoyl dehydrogenase [Erysipelotrichaceae bacterium]|nr:dihydrolipoyl dehydrogenase [Erysipelotrichaceae bacterium]
MKYDVAIIGAGPGGYTAAFRAAEEGLSVIIFERDRFGGTCLNRGCIPTKALLHGALTYGELSRAEKYGVTAEKTGYDMERMTARRDEIVEKLRGDLEKAVKTRKITLVSGQAQLTSGHTVSCNGEEYEAENIIIATGSRVAVPPIEGIDSPHVITSNELLERRDIDYPSLTIIGAGVIGVECASIYLALGREVTLIEMADRILPTMDQEIAQRLAVYLKKKGARIETSVRVISIDDDVVCYLDKKGQECRSQSAAILIAAGRRANVEGLLAEGVQLEINRGITADENGRTSLDGVYVIGDAMAGNIQLAHVAMAQGENVIDTILGRPQSVDMKTVPSCLYSDPEAASVGLGEQQAKDMGIAVRVHKSLTGGNGKSVIEDAESGFVKLVTDENDVIIGAQLVCPHATELISEAALAVQKKMTVKELREVIHPHPSVSEMIAQTVR